MAMKNLGNSASRNVTYNDIICVIEALIFKKRMFKTKRKKNKTKRKKFIFISLWKC